MSTVVVVTPFVTFTPLAVAAGAGWVMVQALAAQDVACARLLERSREELRRERWAAVTLRSSDLERLLRSAREARFRASSLASGVRLTSDTGQPVWAARAGDGLQLVGREEALRPLLAADTRSRAVEFLRGRGFQVDATMTASGETRIDARQEGSRAVTIEVSSRGEATVDPRGFRGPECETFTRDLGAALGGTIVRACRKPEYYTGVTSAPIQVQRRG